MLVKIADAVLHGILDAAKKMYPDEFFCLLGGEKEGNSVKINEIVFIPYKSTRKGAVFDIHSIPAVDRVVGSAHSHPSSTKWSLTDLRTFPLVGDVHLIVAYPFTERDAAFYNCRGDTIPFKVYRSESQF